MCASPLGLSVRAQAAEAQAQVPQSATGVSVIGLGVGALRDLLVVEEAALALDVGRDGQTAGRLDALFDRRQGLMPAPITMLVFMYVPGCRAAAVTPALFNASPRSMVFMTWASLDWQ